MAKVKIRNTAAKQFEIVRKDAKHSQMEMAERLGVSQSTIQRYEAGTTRIPHDIVSKLHQMFGMSYVWYYTNKGPKKEAPVKTTLVTNVADQAAVISHLQLQVERLEKDLKKLYRDFYARETSTP